MKHGSLVTTAARGQEVVYRVLKQKPQGILEVTVASETPGPSWEVTAAECTPMGSSITKPELKKMAVEILKQHPTATAKLEDVMEYHTGAGKVVGKILVHFTARYQDGVVHHVRFSFTLATRTFVQVQG